MIGAVSDLTPKMRAVLEVLSRNRGSLTPNQIGRALRGTPHEPPRTLGRHGKVMGPGSMISPTLLALEKRGYIAWGHRPDGRSGSAYRITEAGREAL